MRLYESLINHKDLTFMWNYKICAFVLGHFQTTAHLEFPSEQQQWQRGKQWNPFRPELKHKILSKSFSNNKKCHNITLSQQQSKMSQRKLKTLKQTNHKFLKKRIWKGNKTEKALNKNILNEDYRVRKCRMHDIKTLFLWATNQIQIDRRD